MGDLHAGQWEGGDTIDSPFGSRKMQTLRKLPTRAPKMKIAREKGIGIENGVI